MIPSWRNWPVYSTVDASNDGITWFDVVVMGTICWVVSSHWYVSRTWHNTTKWSPAGWPALLVLLSSWTIFTCKYMAQLGSTSHVVVVVASHGSVRRLPLPSSSLWWLCVTMLDGTHGYPMVAHSSRFLFPVVVSKLLYPLCRPRIGTRCFCSGRNSCNRPDPDAKNASLVNVL